MPQGKWRFADEEQPTMQMSTPTPQVEGGIGSGVLRNAARLSTIAGEAALLPADIIQGIAQAKLPVEHEANPYKLPKLMGESQVQPRERQPKSPFGIEQRVEEVPEEQRTKTLLPWQGLPSEAFKAAIENKLPEGWLKPQGDFVEPSLDAAARFIPAVARALYTGGGAPLLDIGKVIMSSVALGNVGQALGGKEGRWIGEVAGPIFHGLAQLGKKSYSKFYKDPTSPIEDKVIRLKDDLYAQSGKASKKIKVDSVPVFNAVNKIATEHSEKLPMKESNTFLKEVGRLQNRYFEQQVTTIGTGGVPASSIDSVDKFAMEYSRRLPLNESNSFLKEMAGLRDKHLAPVSSRGGRVIPAAKYYGKYSRYPGDSTMDKLIDAKVFANGQIEAAKDPRLQRAWRDVSNAISQEVTKQGKQHPQFYNAFKRADDLHGMLEDAGKAQELINDTIMKMEPDGPLTRWAKKGMWGFANQVADIFTPSGTRSTLKQAKLYFKVPEVRKLMMETVTSAMANDPVAVQAHLTLLNSILKQPVKEVVKASKWHFM